MIRLRIAHLIDLDRVGGVESMFYALVQALPPAGFEIEHYTIADSLEIAPRFSEAVLRCSRRVTSPKVWHGLKLPRRPHWLRAHNRLAQIRAIKPDLVLAWNQFTDFRIETLNLGCPLVYYEHGMSWYQHSERQLHGFLPHVDAAIAVSQAAARMLALKHAVQFPVQVCMNPLRPELLSQGEAPRRLVPGQVLRLGLAARLVPLKAVGLLILTIKRLQQRGIAAEAWIAGEGPERPVLEALIQREGLTDQVHLLGLVQDMAAFYRSIDLFVLCSMHETMPLVCIEAMAYGVPVIASAIDGMPEVVQDRITGRCLSPSLSIDDYATQTASSTAFARQVYQPEHDQLVETRLLSPEAIADAIQQLHENPDAYHTMSGAALQQAGQGFSFPDYLQRFYTLLAEFASKR